MLDVSSDVIGAGVGVPRSNVHVSGPGCTAVAEVWVHVSYLSGICRHAAGRFTRLDVTPDHWCHITFVVHEASIEVWSVVWVWGGDVSESTREWIL